MAVVELAEKIPPELAAWGCPLEAWRAAAASAPRMMAMAELVAW